MKAREIRSNDAQAQKKSMLSNDYDLFSDLSVHYKVGAMWTNQYSSCVEQLKCCSTATITDVFFSQGQLRINPKKYHEAFIPAPVS